MPMDIETHRQLGLDQPIAAEVNGRINGVVNDPAWDINYPPCPEAYPAASAPTGQVHKFSDWIGSQVYPATTRDLWIYTPAVKSSKPRRVIIFNDGAWYLSRKGSVRATHVLDSLHSQAEIEPTVAIFVTPGIPSHPVKGPIDSYDYPAAQRSLEYDSLGDAYARFLRDEILAEVGKKYSLSKDPANRLSSISAAREVLDEVIQERAADRVIQAHGVTIIGYTNLPAQVPNHASQMYSRNLTTVLAHLVNDGELQIDLADEITAGALLAHEGAVANERVRQLLGASAPETEA